MNQYEKRQLKKKPSPKLKQRYNKDIHKVDYKTYRRAYIRWFAARQKGHDLELQLLDNPRLKLVHGKPKWVDVKALLKVYFALKASIKRFVKTLSFGIP